MVPLAPALVREGRRQSWGLQRRIYYFSAGRDPWAFYLCPGLQSIPVVAWAIQAIPILLGTSSLQGRSLDQVPTPEARASTHCRYSRPYCTKLCTGSIYGVCRIGFSMGCVHHLHEQVALPGTERIARG